MDKEIDNLINLENRRISNTYNLIASENIPSEDVLLCLGSCLSIKYSEGEIGKRYYMGNNFIDKIESICKKRVLKLFKCEKNYRANVAVPTGAIANLAAYLTFLNPGDKILSLTLKEGAHISHSLNINFVGKFYNIINYNLENNKLDYKKILEIALREKPKLIICGFTSYPFKIDFKKFYDIAKKTNSFLMADISHIAGLIAAGKHSSPIPWADVITSTTHKTLRGPRSAFILVKKEYEDKLNKTIFPGLLGGPKNNEIAAKAVCFKEASTNKFKNYIKKVLFNTKYLHDKLVKIGFDCIGTENHLFLVNLKKFNIDGRLFAEELEKIGIIVNSNSIPNDEGTPWRPQGIRIGLALETTKGITLKDLDKIAFKIGTTMLRIHKLIKCSKI